MSFLSDYEKRMLKNREENKKVLASLGLDKPFFPTLNAQRKVSTKKAIKRKRSENEKPRKAQRSSSDSVQTRELAQSSEDDWRTKYGRRRSGRLMGKEPGDFQGLTFEEEDEEDEKPKKIPRNRENIFGQIPGIEVGKFWSTRLECSADGIHRPTVAGIHGNASEGCYSLALSGGYEDDIDYGDCFTYTGEGGRDLKGTKSNPKNLRTAPQSKDQTLTRGNLALTKNVEKGHPVRVIRGYKLDSPFAPEEGYRYDGLYTVEKYWQSVGLSGFMVYKFALKRCDNQPPAVWHTSDLDEDEDVVEEDSEVSQEENTVASCNSPSKDNKNPSETASIAADSEENKSTDCGVGETTENGASENGVNDETNRGMNGRSEERRDGVSDQDGLDGTAGDDDDDEHANTTSEQQRGSSDQTTIKVNQDRDDADDDDDDHANTISEQQRGNSDQANIKVKQDRDGADDDDKHHVTNVTLKEDGGKQTSLKATAGDVNDDDGDKNIMESAPTDQSIDEKNDQDADDDDKHHVTNVTLKEDGGKQTSLKATQGDVNDDDGDKNTMESAPTDQSIEEKNDQVEN